jgi:hypothetical protein
MTKILRFIRPSIIALLVLTVTLSYAQITQAPIRLKQAAQQENAELSAIEPQANGFKNQTSAHLSKIFIQFNAIPGSRKIQQLKARGIELIDYVPENTYLALVKGKWSVSALKELGIVATIPLQQNFKMAQAAPAAKAPKSGATTNYHIFFSPELDSNAIRSRLRPYVSPRFLNGRLAEIACSPATLSQLLEQSFVLYAQPALPMLPFNFDATDNLGAQSVQIGANGVPGLKGKGVVMGVGDDGRVDHIDNGFYTEGQDYYSSYHATHVAGTMIGAGVINPIMKGFAPEATLLVDFFNTIIYRVPDYYPNKRMVLTNNSYGIGSYCVPYSGEYSGYSGQVDQQLLDYPNLMHVFAAGNSGALQCGAYPKGYRTIDNSFQAAKNVLTIGGTSRDGLANKFSKGPVNDGRIKPEIAGIGYSMLSTIPGNGYGTNQGTSMSAPQVTGALALLYERYRQLNGDQDPPGDLAKAILCNTATDIGIKGVDFSAGFGWMNLKKAIDVVNDKSYRSGSIEQGEEQVIDITLDKEVFDFKIMLYWHDKPSSYYTLKNLVNDLDITVLLPNGSTYDPMVLDTSAAGVTKPAAMGKDHINNIEQVVIDHALPGRYTIKIKGYKIPFGPQLFKLVYNWETPALAFTQPAGGEQWKPGELRGIHWLDPGHDTEPHSFDYSTDDGLNWINIPGITGTYNRADFTLPAVTSAFARIRINNTTTGSSTISNAFALLPEMKFSLKSDCASTIDLAWSKPNGIDSVAVLLYTPSGYQQQAITTDSFYTISGLRSGPLYFITLQPILDGKMGERSIAQSIYTANTPCSFSSLPNDMALNAILLPAIGREKTSSAVPPVFPISLQLQNTGSIVFTDSIFVSVLRDGNLLGKDTLVKFFSPGRVYKFTTKITTTATPGTSAKFTALIKTTADPNNANNQLDSNWRYLANPAIALPFTEDFTKLTDSVYARPGVTGITGSEAWDFAANSAALSLLTKHLSPNNGFHFKSQLVGEMLQLTGTFNLSNYQRTDNIRAAFGFPDQEEFVTSYSVRGSDTAAWNTIPIIDPVSGLPNLKSINISAALAKDTQQLSSSFQIRLDIISQGFKQDLRLINNFQLFKSVADLQITGIKINKNYLTDGDSLLVDIGVSNNNFTVNGPFTVQLRLPNGVIQSNRYDSLPASGSVIVSFNKLVGNWPKANDSIRAWIENPGDSYTANDSVQAALFYARKISSFPYLEGFESGAAGWGSSYLYKLNNQLPATAPQFTAANGNICWLTDRVLNSFDIATPVPNGYLLSPLFDMSALKQPYLSMSVNKQLCEAKDKVQVQYSADTGRTWLPLYPLTGVTNWYGPGTDSSWQNCGDDYWQVVSAPLPTGVQSIQLRILTVGANKLSDEFPRLPGGLLVDDIHIFDRTFSIYSDTLSTGFPAPAKTDNINYFLTQLEIAAAFGNNPQSIFNSLKLSAGRAPNFYKGNRVLPITYIFNGNDGQTDSAFVRLYFTDALVKKWLLANPCDTCMLKRSAYDLSVFRYAGTTSSINETEADNVAGFESIWSPEAFTLVPYDAGYYAEIPAAAYGEFYIGLDENALGLQFDASKQPGAPIALLNFSLAQTAGILRYEIERASSQTPANFEMIKTIQQDGSNKSYRYRDVFIQPPVVYSYRLKIVYANGDIRYSALRTLSFDNFIMARVYPNPSRDGLVNLLLQNTEGMSVALALYDQSGRLLWQQQVAALSQQQLVPISAGKALPNGVYALTITAEGEKKTIQLVISRN